MVTQFRQQMALWILRLLFQLLQWTIIFGAAAAIVHDNYAKLDVVAEIENPLKEKNAVLSHIKLLEKKGIKYPWVVMAQEVHETGWFTSPVYREGYNRFGMKVNSRKYHKGKHRGHAKYNSYEDSILDYYEWQRMRLAQNRWVKTDEDYIDMLIKVKYAEDRDYKKRIVETKKRLEELAALTSQSN